MGGVETQEYRSSFPVYLVKYAPKHVDVQTDLLSRTCRIAFVKHHRMRGFTLVSVLNGTNLQTELCTRISDNLYELPIKNEHIMDVPKMVTSFRMYKSTLKADILMNYVSFDGRNFN